MSTVAVQPGALPPEGQIAQILLGQVVPRLVYVAAALKLPDFLADGPKEAEEVAAETATDPAALYRVMRSMAAIGLLSEDAQHRFSLQPLGAVLKSGTPSHAAALILGGDLLTRSLDHFVYSVRTGKPGFDAAFGKPMFEWLGENTADANLFNLTMVGFHGLEPAAVAAAYDFSGFGTVADVGGSTGNMLATILERYEGPKGILFDLPHVVKDASALFAKRGLTERVRIEAGSFFETAPKGADAYLLSHVIHDWDPQQCQTILGNVRRSMAQNGRLLLVEMVLPEGNVPHPGKFLDMVMLTTPGGEERTPSQYETLLDQAGFRMTRVVPTASAVSVVEAEPK